MYDYKDNNKIKIIHKPNGGVSSARNVGLANTNSKWCMFVDSDDWLCNDCVEKFLSVVDNNSNIDYIISKVNIVDGKNVYYNTNKINKSMFIDKEMIIFNIIINQNSNLTSIEPVWAKLFNVQFLKKYDLYFNSKLKSGEDVIFNLECAEKASNIYYLNETTYNYSYNNFSECRTCENLEIKTTVLLNEMNRVLAQFTYDTAGYYDYYVARAISRLLRKYFIKYKSYRKFVKDFSYIINLPEYKKVITDPNTKYLEPDKVNLINMCKQSKFNEIFDAMSNGQIKK